MGEKGRQRPLVDPRKAIAGQRKRQGGKKTGCGVAFERSGGGAKEKACVETLKDAANNEIVARRRMEKGGRTRTREILIGGKCRRRVILARGEGTRLSTSACEGCKGKEFRWLPENAGHPLGVAHVKRQLSKEYQGEAGDVGEKTGKFSCSKCEKKNRKGRREKEKKKETAVGEKEVLD